MASLGHNELNVFVYGLLKNCMTGWWKCQNIFMFFLYVYFACFCHASFVCFCTFTLTFFSCNTMYIFFMYTYMIHLDIFSSSITSKPLSFVVLTTLCAFCILEILEIVEAHWRQSDLHLEFAPAILTLTCDLVNASLVQKVRSILPQQINLENVIGRYWVAF